MQPDRCQKRQKVRNDVSLHRLCRYRGQNEEQTERGETGSGEDARKQTERERERRATNKIQTEREGKERWERAQRDGASVSMRGRT